MITQSTIPKHITLYKRPQRKPMNDFKKTLAFDYMMVTRTFLLIFCLGLGFVASLSGLSLFCKTPLAPSN